MNILNVENDGTENNEQFTHSPVGIIFFQTAGCERSLYKKFPVQRKLSHEEERFLPDLLTNILAFCTQ